MTTKPQKVGEIIRSQMQNSWKISPPASVAVTTNLPVKTEAGLELSIYSQELVSPRDIGVEMKRLREAFPKQSNEFFNLLTERVLANGFSAERLHDAVNRVIDGFVYKELNIADIIGYDKRVKLYTYGELADQVSNGRATMADFEIREIRGKKYWVRKTDL